MVWWISQFPSWDHLLDWAYRIHHEARGSGIAFSVFYLKYHITLFVFDFSLGIARSDLYLLGIYLIYNITNIQAIHKSRTRFIGIIGVQIEFSWVFDDLYANCCISNETFRHMWGHIYMMSIVMRRCERNPVWKNTAQHSTEHTMSIFHFICFVDTDED